MRDNIREWIPKTGYEYRCIYISCMRFYQSNNIYPFSNIFHPRRQTAFEWVRCNGKFVLPLYSGYIKY